MRSAATVVLSALALAFFQTGDTRAASEPCKPVRFENQSFTVCTADPARHDIRLHLKKSDGTIYGQLDALPTGGLLFAMNAGMFHENRDAVGLYVEGGKQLFKLNTNNGPGNFHLMPNGVFWIKDGRAAVTATSDYQKIDPTPDLATQSGPMLVTGGAMHPKFEANGSSRYVRNGVGIGADGAAIFAISEEPVSFGVFARLFRDQIKCRDALYLDGSVTRLYVPGENRSISGGALGPMFGVYDKHP